MAKHPDDPGTIDMEEYLKVPMNTTVMYEFVIAAYHGKMPKLEKGRGKRMVEFHVRLAGGHYVGGRTSIKLLRTYGWRKE